jgi:uncharacterized protein YgiM (DUF1202 family)
MGIGLRLRLIAVTFCLVALAPTSPFAANRVALVIGNDTYETLPALNNAQADARGMAAKLRGLGFEVILKLDASSRDIGRSLAEFEGKAANAEVALVFYAGHGIQANGENYLIPSNAEIEVEEDLELESIPASLFLQKMKNAGANLNIVILDACRDNPLLKRSRSAARGLAVTPMPVGISGTAIVFSAAPGQVAHDGPEGGHGVFTGALLQVLDRSGLKLEDVFKQTAIKVLAATSGMQKPWMNSSLTGDFYFRPAAQAKREKSVSVMDQIMYVSGDGKLNVRAGPDSASSKLAELDRGTSLIVTGDVAGNEWYRVRLANGIVGFAWNKRLSYQRIQIEEIDREMYVNGDGILNLRSGPNTRFGIIKKLEPGASLDVTGKVNGKEWYRIGLANGKTAYAWSKRLSYQKILIEEMDWEMYVNGNEKLKVRSGPGTRYDVLKILRPSMSVDVTGKVAGKEWYRINAGKGLQGFVWSKRIFKKSNTAASEQNDLR